MKVVTVLNGQTLIDIAMQELGDATRLFELADLNNMLPTDDVLAGATLVVPEAAAGKTEIAKNLQLNKPATFNSVVQENTQEGIGYWGIGIDFKVS